jgi:hypothetical protein
LGVSECMRLPWPAARMTTFTACRIARISLLQMLARALRRAVAGEKSRPAISEVPMTP